MMAMVVIDLYKAVFSPERRLDKALNGSAHSMGRPFTGSGGKRSAFWFLLNELDVAISEHLWLIINSLHIRGLELFRPH
jgi:hypothetical protein